ncbi:(3R)-hydroxyacyl-(acyl carrier protein) dehydratase [Geotalea daltonii FRC-32]|jgi:3-hydroxyacyl-[acyl-carrier-protein] dehydratase|uniref:3-hydroxyacyl-[acyl-carrier-protein] dehydratase FabZ n=1 Tax=Geotalea daltonii (strain DSM 22248 / JCM 15807 / FRC-32) TaxID=316067 RepID=B9M8V9_GEODF|nr:MULTISPECIES: 3-hydroxyacyl-ACP dehydratase FabZ [Geotalea]ACM20455.1 (3R)-hydroxyacyl-(acyl carrier protein) dehydratase [Geotalea daltonii FRC-32]
MMDINEIMKILPHRYPFLLVDRIVEMEPAKRIVGLKNVTINEPFFQGHFPGHPVMPGVLIVEAMAQVAGIMAYLASDEETRKKVSYFMSIDSAKFRKPVFPGDQLRIEIETIFHRRGIWSVAGKAFVGDVLATEAELKATFAEKSN